MTEAATRPVNRFGVSRRKAARAASLHFEARCVICGGAISAGQRSDDHFLPRAFAPGGETSRLGLVFPAHQDCNNRRGCTAADAEMIARAGEMLAGLGTAGVFEASANIRSAEAALTAHAGALRGLRLAMARELERLARGRG